MLKLKTKEREGETFIFLEAILWSLFPVITILSLKNIPPLLSLAWSTLFAAIFFGVVLSIKKGWSELRNKEALKDILFTTFILGIVYYFFYFFGLLYTSAGNASLIALTETFFSFLYFNVWHKEYISFVHILGAIMMLFGAAIVLYPNVHKFQLGDLLVMAASFIAPFGNYFQRRAREKVKSEAILFIRNAISAPVIFIIAYSTHVNFTAINLEKSFIFLIIIGIVLFGFTKLLWIEGIHRINVAKANALGSVAPVFTLLFAWIMLGNIPTKFQLLSFIPMFFGIMLLGMNRKKEVMSID